MPVKVSVKQANPGWLKTRIDKAKGLGGKEVVAGFPKGSEKASSTYDNGFSVLDNAITQNFGASINHPGGTPYFTRKDGMMQFVKKGSPGAAGLPVTKPHKIVIPARNFMDEAVKILEEDSKMEGAYLAKKVLHGELTPDEALAKIAQIAEDAIRIAILNGEYAPNAASTIAKKGSSKPLVDKGNSLARSVASDVRDRSN